MIRDILLLVLVVSLAAGARSFLPAEATVTGSGAAFAMGFVILATAYAGRIFHRLRLPHLTGFLLCGAVLGPAIGGILTGAMLHDLSVVKRVAIGLIALVAGCELDLRALRPRLEPIGAMAAGGLWLGVMALWGFFFCALPYLPATAGLHGLQRVTVALEIATVLCALSPSVVIGLLTETRSAGPLSEAAMSIVVLADLVIVIAFTATSALTGFAFGDASGNGGFAALVAHIGGSGIVGALLGGVMAVYVQQVRRRVALFVFSVLFIVAEAGMVISLDPLLVGLTAGLVLENASPVGGERVVHETRPATAPVFALFFGVVGAEIHLRNFLEMAGWALAAACVRAGAFVIGSQHGARVAGVPRSLSRLVPFGMLPQAGVALALADLLASSPQAWARGIAPLVFATIVVNELTGPILFRAALVRSGEIGAKDRPRIELPAPEAIRRVR